MLAATLAKVIAQPRQPIALNLPRTQLDWTLANCGPKPGTVAPLIEATLSKKKSSHIVCPLVSMICPLWAKARDHLRRLHIYGFVCMIQLWLCLLKMNRHSFHLVRQLAWPRFLAHHQMVWFKFLRCAIWPFRRASTVSWYLSQSLARVSNQNCNPMWSIIRRLYFPSSTITPFLLMVIIFYYGDSLTRLFSIYSLARFARLA